MEVLQLVKELGEPEPETVVAKLDGEVDHDHDHRHPDKKNLNFKTTPVFFD